MKAKLIKKLRITMMDQEDLKVYAVNHGAAIPSEYDDANDLALLLPAGFRERGGQVHKIERGEAMPADVKPGDLVLRVSYPSD